MDKIFEMDQKRIKLLLENKQLKSEVERLQSDNEHIRAVNLKLNGEVELLKKELNIARESNIQSK
jgi:cell division protein FtsB